MPPTRLQPPRRTPSAKPQGQTSPAELLADMPRRPLSPQQQAEALKKVQAQAEQRVKLGMQLFKAAEARLAAQQDIVKEVKQQQDALKLEVQEDVVKTLQSYDQWMGQIDEGFTKALRDLTDRLDQLENGLEDRLKPMQAAADRAEAMLQQAQALLEQTASDPMEESRVSVDPIHRRVDEADADDSLEAELPAGPLTMTPLIKPDPVPTAETNEPVDPDEPFRFDAFTGPLPMSAVEEESATERQEVFSQVLKQLQDDGSDPDPPPRAA